MIFAALTAGVAQAQTSDLVDVTGTFANNAPLTPYSSPGGTFSADITVPSALTYDSSAVFNFAGDFSAFRYRLNGGSPTVVDRPFAFVDTSQAMSGGPTFLDIQDGFRLTTAVSNPSFFVGSFENGGSLIPGTYALTEASAITPTTGGFAQISSGTMTISPVPEPSTLALLGGATGLAAGIFFRRNKRKPVEPAGDGFADGSPSRPPDRAAAR